MADIDIGTLTATITGKDELSPIFEEISRKLPSSFDLLHERIVDLATEQLKLAKTSEAAAEAFFAMGGELKVTADQAASLFKEIQEGLPAFEALGKEVPASVNEASDSLKNFLIDSGKLKDDRSPEEVKNKWHEAGESLNGVFEHVTEGIGEMAQKFIDFKGIAATLATGGLLVGIAEIGEKFEDSSHKIEKATGRTGEELEALNKSVDNVLPHVSSSLGEVTDAVTALAQRTDLAGQPLEDMTATMLDLAQVSGMQVGPLVRDSTRAFESWNIATADQTDALTFLMHAAQNSGAGVGELLGQVTRLGAPLRELGFSFKDSVALFAQFEKAGIDTGRAMQGLRTALGQFSKAGLEPKAALEDLIKKIKETDDEQEALAMGMKAFGSRGGADMVAAIRNGKLNLEEFRQKIEETKGTIKEIADHTEGLQGKFQKLANAVEVAARPLGEMLIHRLEDVLQTTVELTEKIQPFIDKIKDLTGAVETLDGKTGEITSEGGISDWAATFTNVGIGAAGLSLAIRGVQYVLTPLISTVDGAITKLGFEAGLGGVFKGLVSEGGLLAIAIGAIEIPINNVAEATRGATERVLEGTGSWKDFGDAITHAVATSMNPYSLILDILRDGNEVLRQGAAAWDLFWIAAHQGSHLTPQQNEALVNRGGAALPKPPDLATNVDVAGHYEKVDGKIQLVDKHLIDLTKDSKAYDEVLGQLSAENAKWNESLKPAPDLLGAARRELAKFKAEDPRFDLFAAEVKSGVVQTSELTKEFGLSATAISLYKKELEDAKKAQTEHTKAVAEANKEADKFNEAQHKSAQKLLEWGVYSQEAIATGLEPLYEQFNTIAASAGDQLPRAFEQGILPKLIELRQRAAEAGQDTTIFDQAIRDMGEAAHVAVPDLERINQELKIWTQTGQQLVTVQAGIPIQLHKLKLETDIAADAFHQLGLKTPQELQKIAEAAEKNYRIVASTAGVTKQQVQKAWDEMTKAQLEAQGKVPSAWVTEIFPKIKQTASQIKSAVMGEFDSMLLGATSFKDGMLKIWDDIKAGILRILTEILSDFAGRFLKGLLGAMSGEQGAFAKAFQGLFGGGGGGLPGMGGGSIWQKLFGIGGGAPGGGIPQVPIYEGGLGTMVPLPGELAGGIPAYGAPGFVPGTGVPGFGAGAGGAIFGGIGAGAAGFGTGALFQHLFGRGVGSAAGGAGAGAAEGALIGSILPGLGTAIGALIGGLSGLLGGIINFGPSKQELAGRSVVSQFQQDSLGALTDSQRKEAMGAGWADPSAAATLIRVRDAYIAMGKTAAEAEADVKAMWDAEKKGPEAVAKAMIPINEALEKQKEQTEKTNKALDEQKTKYDEIKKKITDQMDDLNKQLDHINKSEAPEAHMGVIEKRERERIAREQDALQKQLNEAEEANKKALEEIAKQGQATTDQIGDGIRTFPEIMGQVAPEILALLKTIGLDGTGKDALGKLSEFFMALPQDMDPSKQELIDALKEIGITGVSDVALGKISMYLEDLRKHGIDVADDIGDHLGGIKVPPVKVPVEYDYPEGETPHGPPREAPEPGDSGRPYALGGTVYAATGMTIPGPRGTDTVRAWLTPGEEVTPVSGVQKAKALFGSDFFNDLRAPGGLDFSDLRRAPMPSDLRHYEPITPHVRVNTDNRGEPVKVHAPVVVLPVIGRPDRHLEDVDKLLATLLKAAPSIQRNRSQIRTALIEALGIVNK